MYPWVFPWTRPSSFNQAQCGSQGQELSPSSQLIHYLEALGHLPPSLRCYYKGDTFRLKIEGCQKHCLHLQIPKCMMNIPWFMPFFLPWMEPPCPNYATTVQYPRVIRPFHMGTCHALPAWVYKCQTFLEVRYGHPHLLLLNTNSSMCTFHNSHCGDPR